MLKTRPRKMAHELVDELKKGDALITLEGLEQAKPRFTATVSG